MGRKGGRVNQRLTGFASLCSANNRTLKNGAEGGNRTPSSRSTVSYTTVILQPPFTQRSRIRFIKFLKLRAGKKEVEVAVQPAFVYST